MTSADKPPLFLNASERSAAFVDGANLQAAARALDIEIDYRRLRDLLREKCHLVRALYYIADAGDPEFSSIRPLIDWLDYNGFSTVTKAPKAFPDSNGRRRSRQHMHVELTADALRLAEYLDHVIIFSGDGNLTPLVAALQYRGTRVSIVSTLRTQPPMVADELRRQADQFIELAELDIRPSGGERRLR